MLISNLETLSEKATLFYVKNIQVENTAKDDIWRECRIDHDLTVGGGGNPPKLELTGGRPGGDFLVNLGPKTLNNMGSSCEKEYGHRRFSISTSFPI